MRGPVDPTKPNPIVDAGAHAAAAAAAISWPADMTEVQKLGHEATVRSFGALHAAAAATESWTKNVIAPVFDGGAASCRAYGPLERDVANVYESTFVHRKQAVAEANGMVKVFEKRLERFEASLDHGVAQLSQAKQLGEAAKGKSGKIDSVNDGVKAACKKIQEMLECEVKCAEEREGKESSRREAAGEKKKAVLSEINGRRERIAQDVKDREAKLYEEHSKAEQTEDYV